MTGIRETSSGRERRVSLGQTGISISPIGLGCWQLSRGSGIVGRYWPALDRATEQDVVRASIDNGVNLFDTAEAYGWGESERALSGALSALGECGRGALIATKWWPIMRFAGDIRRSVADRLAALGGLPIALHQVHHWLSLSSVAAQMDAMADLVDAGTIRSVGVSNFGERAMRAAHRALGRRGLPLASNQVRYSLVDRRIERNGVLKAAKDLGVTVIAYSPLAQGILSGRFHRDPGARDAAGTRRRLPGFSDRALARQRTLVETLEEVARAHDATPAQVALSWTISFHGDTVVAIPGARTPEQARINARSMGIDLSRDELGRIDRASRAGGA